MIVVTAWVIVEVLFLAWVGLAGRPAARFDLSKHKIPVDQIVSGGPGKDGIPAILNSLFVRASDANFLTAEDRGLGDRPRRRAKAYPIKILNWHETVNDTIGGKPIVITYCPLCGTGIGFDAIIQGQPYTFGVSGLLYQSHLLMYDYQTESLWSQIAMEAVAGPLTGAKLTHRFLTYRTWREWQTHHPTTLGLSTKTSLA